MATRDAAFYERSTRAFNYSISGGLVSFLIGFTLGAILQFFFPEIASLVVGFFFTIGGILLTVAVAIYVYQVFRGR